MSAISSQDIISILKEEIENYDFEAKDPGKLVMSSGLVTELPLSMELTRPCMVRSLSLRTA